ncbi:MAG: hypothetical protein ABR915_10780, partial [Thermoguttaceae bacterium]
MDRHFRGFLSAALILNGLALASLAGQSGTIDPGCAELSLSVEGLLKDGKPLAMRLITALGAVQGVTAVDPPDVKVAVGGTIDGRSIRAVVNGAGKSPGTLTLDIAIDGAKLSGTYSGTWNKVAVTGAVSGAARPGKGILEGDPKPPLELVKASYFGTSENDDFEGAAAGPDGCLYLAGNAGAPIRQLPGGVAPVAFGGPAAEPLCGCGFVLKLSPDASKVLAYAEFGKGILHATAVAVADKGVYVGGYAYDALEPLLAERKGLMTAYPLRTEQKLIQEGKMLEANGFPAGATDSLAGRPGLGRLGAPCVLRFSADLKTLENGTYLEGWQQIYDKFRICGRLKGRFHEYFWQPINICPLRSGDVVVAHDGGYFRMLTDKDREAARKLASPEDQAALL